MTAAAWPRTPSRAAPGSARASSGRWRKAWKARSNTMPRTAASARRCARRSADASGVLQFADEADDPGLARALEAFGGKDRLHAGEAFFDIVIDQDVVVTVPMADLVLGARHAGVDDLLAVGRPAFEAVSQLGHRGRQDEHAHHVAA